MVGHEWCAPWCARHSRPGAAGRVAAEAAGGCRADPGGSGGTVRGFRARHRRSGAGADAAAVPELGAGAGAGARAAGGGRGRAGRAVPGRGVAAATPAGDERAERRARRDRRQPTAGRRRRRGERRGGTAVPRQLPAGVAHFAGRGAELAALDAVLDGGPAALGDGTGVVISAIGGTAGVGKTALALHWAHQVADRFPDGQLYANLRGFDAGAGQPADPADVLRGFLDAFGVHPERIPHDTESLAALYRSVLAGRKMLVLLDNAADVAQVRPLLPASPECLVIVTSRRELSALAAREGALLVQLDVLSAAGGQRTAGRAAGRGAGGRRAVGGDRAGDAVRAAAAGAVGHRRAGRRRAPAAAGGAGGGADRARRAARRARRGGSGGERADRALAVLPAPAGRRRRGCSGCSGSIRDPTSAPPRPRRWPACPPSDARVALRDLVRASLLNETVPGRYAFHDLLRAYAAEQSALTTSAAGVENTTRRMLDHYLQTAHHAHVVLYPGRELIDPAARRGRGDGRRRSAARRRRWPGSRPRTRCCSRWSSLAASAGFDAHAWQLPVVLWTYHNVCGHWHDGARLHRTRAGGGRAVRRPERAGVRAARARLVRDVGRQRSQRRTSACRRRSRPSPRSATTSGSPGPT